MAVAIKVENLSKAYQLGEIGTGTLSRDVERWIAKVRGKEDPFLKIGETNDRTSKGESNIVWSLKDINFDIQQGNAIGIIGRNGAGKSTLLKLLSRVTSPTTGSIKVKGRIASLLEVGTGFHPELTGKENIYLNGAILGMRKKEIKQKFEEIVDFAGVERYIDTPVKRYSSGMYVRLAFAVAAYLESEILIVDEVLAVGDAEFQKKCLGKMNDVSKGEGRTVLFVSHNMSSILDLTEKTLLLINGQVKEYGNSSLVVNNYLSLTKSSNLIYNAEPKQFEPSLVKAQIFTSGANNIHYFGENIKFEFELHMPNDMIGMCLSFQIFDLKERACFYNWIHDSEMPICRDKGTHRLICEIPNFKLYQGKYNLTVHLAEQRGKQIYKNVENICPFEVVMKENHEWGWGDDTCVFMENSIWNVMQLSNVK